MSYRTRLNTDPLRLEATYCGVLTPRELEQAASEILALARENGTMLLLADCADVAGGHSVEKGSRLAAVVSPGFTPCSQVETCRTSGAVSPFVLVEPQRSLRSP
jgi:hypothetical protein